MALIALMCGTSVPDSRVHALAHYIAESLDSCGHTTFVIDSAQTPADVLLTGDSGSPAAEYLVGLVESADAILPITPVKNGSFSAVLKAMLDLLPRGALTGKVVMPIATGGTASRLTEVEYALTPVVADLGGRHILRGVYLLDRDLEVHGCGAVLAPGAEYALRQSLQQLSATLGGAAVASADDDLLVSGEDAIALHQKGALLLDVRSDGVSATIRVRGAVHVDKNDVLALFDPNSVRSLGIRTDRPIVAFCKSERGSRRVVRVLRDCGYTDVHHVRDGIAGLGYMHLARV